MRLTVVYRRVSGEWRLAHRVVVAPITRAPPLDPRDALSIRSVTVRRIGLDDEPPWVVLTALNAFVWPGPDLPPLPGEGVESAIIGALAVRFMATLNEPLQAREVDDEH